MAKRWWFKQQQDPSQRWTWRVLRGDGTIERQAAADFENYGAVVHDAIRNGFGPKEDHWVIDTTHGLTHYEPGKEPVGVPKPDRSTPRDPAPPGKVESLSEQQELPSTAIRRPEEQGQ